MQKGKIKFTAANAVLPAKFETKYTVYDGVERGEDHHEDGRERKANELAHGHMLRKVESHRSPLNRFKIVVACF